MESWKLNLTQGFLPQWKTERLQALLTALETDDQRLTQGSTTTPPPLMSVQDWPLEACDITVFASVDDFDCTVGEAEEAFAKACLHADQRLGGHYAYRWWLNWHDDTPRHEMFAAVASVVRDELQRRQHIKLSPELQRALEQQPDDEVLRRACFDYVLGEGGTEDDATRCSGWGGGL